MRKTSMAILFSVCAAIWASPAVAEYGAPLVLAMDSGAQGAPYLSGGVGETERDEIQAREKDFNLKLLFAEKSGAYLVDVRVAILSSDGHSVLALDAAGPFLLVKLPAGRYLVQATANNQRQRITLQVGDKHLVARVLHW